MATHVPEGPVDGTRDRTPTPSSPAAAHLERDPTIRRLRAPDDVRALVAERGLAVATPARTMGHLSVVALLYLGGLAVGVTVDRWWCWAAVWAVQSFLLLACGAVMHEGVHGNLTGHRAVDRVLSFVGGWLIFLPAPAYRPYHLQHHATTISADDPSSAVATPFRSRRQYLLVMALSGPGFCAQMWAIALSTWSGGGPGWMSDRHRRQVRRESALAVVLYATVVLTAAMAGWGWWLLVAWVVPAVLGLCVVAPYILTPEHYLAPSDATLVESTATVRSNRLVGFVYLNNNHHLAHHLLASCNPRRLGEITDLVWDRAELRWDSYAQFHRRVWTSLDW